MHSLKNIPEELVDQYDTRKIAVNGWVHTKIRKGMPGLKQARKSLHGQLKYHLTQFKYCLCQCMTLFEDTQNTTNQFHTGSGKIRIKILQKAACTTPN